jgi:predicted TIM-barrel fold metal-dependent hydrolase
MVKEGSRLNVRQTITYDDMVEGAYDQAARLRAMDENHTEASLCFPTVPRFCGQLFMNAIDKDLALSCVRAFNNWMIDEWCGGEGIGRLIPLTIIPLWDVEVAAAEIRRCADMGSHAVSFSECPPHLGLPSIHSGYWTPMFAACQETETVVNLHIGTSSRVAAAGPDAPPEVGAVLLFQNSVIALIDWIASGVLERFPHLRVALSEGQAGWVPYVLERMDSVWERSNLYDEGMRDRVSNRPSSYIAGRMFFCMFDDVFAIESRERIGMSQLMVEVDYPHADSTYPSSELVIGKMVERAHLTQDETNMLVRNNAISCYGLERYGIYPSVA